jgi:predicted  nucleic acid-binding Zn-ribbon protein
MTTCGYNIVKIENIDENWRNVSHDLGDNIYTTYRELRANAPLKKEIDDFEKEVEDLKNTMSSLYGP